LAVEHVETRLANEYEALRRREYELITRLLDLLPRIDSLPSERVDQVRDALFHADHPYLMVFVGPFSSGKSSLINALLGADDLLAVGPVPTTDRISILRWGDERDIMPSGDVDTVFYPTELLKKVSLVDTPGLESIFQKHEDTTRKFLHRSDVVILVMLATQAMTARNLEYLRSLKEYGKKVIVVVNQADLLTPEESEAVRQYVVEQSQSQSGYKPDVWMVSAKLAAEARTDGGRIAEVWAASGLGKIEQYIDEQLSDVARLKQKLQTPLQIMQRVNQTALDALKTNQTALDQYRNINDNINQQLNAQKRELDRAIRETTDEIGKKFSETAMRGSEAIRDLFRINRALGLGARGMLELIPGLGNLTRRGATIRAAFEARKAFEPIDELVAVTNKLAPRLEGRDVQDFDDLVKYARREIDALPPTIRGKLIGTVQAPIQYERAAMQETRDPLESIENEARVVETDRLESALRNTLLYLGAWEVLVIIFGIALINTWGQIGSSDPVLPVILLVVLLAFGMGGFLAMPLRGRLLEASYTNRLLSIQARYVETLSKAADKQVEYSMSVRRDIVLPLTRLVEAQVQLQTEQMNELQAIQGEMTKLEADLMKLGKRNLLGIGS
jgi:GTP-binding protein EngB required for normal cell division